MKLKHTSPQLPDLSPAVRPGKNNRTRVPMVDMTRVLVLNLVSRVENNADDDDEAGGGGGSEEFEIEIPSRFSPARLAQALQPHCSIGIACLVLYVDVYRIASLLRVCRASSLFSYVLRHDAEQTACMTFLNTFVFLLSCNFSSTKIELFGALPSGAGLKTIKIGPPLTCIQTVQYNMSYRFHFSVRENSCMFDVNLG